MSEMFSISLENLEELYIKLTDANNSLLSCNIDKIDYYTNEGETSYDNAVKLVSHLFFLI